MRSETNRDFGHSEGMTDSVLILEDDPFIAEDMAWGIEQKLGVSPIIASSNREAIAHIDKGIGFAFLDLHVADGMSTSVADRLKAMRLPFAFVTGSDNSELPPRLRHEVFIRKPADTSTLISVIKNAAYFNDRDRAEEH